jgi:hypothetical protein
VVGIEFRNFFNLNDAHWVANLLPKHLVLFLVDKGKWK